MGFFEVEVVFIGEDGVLVGLKDNVIVVDCLIVVFELIVWMVWFVEVVGGCFVDVLMMCGVREVYEGWLNLLVGVMFGLFVEIWLVFVCFVENIMCVGDVGVGYSMKFLYNYVLFGIIVLLLEVVVCVKCVGVDVVVFVDVFVNGGGGGVVLNWLCLFLEFGDMFVLLFYMVNVLKDLLYYLVMVEGVDVVYVIVVVVMDMYCDVVVGVGVYCLVLKLIDVLMVGFMCDDGVLF